jgi:alanine-glyoxylate transaminase/serine-glyoxylate transaminase/serine-pyruvate transaminase
MFVPRRDIVVAGGLHKDVKDTYFRVGHMGVTVTDPSRGDLEKIMKGIRESLAEAGYKH